MDHTHALFSLMPLLPHCKVPSICPCLPTPPLSLLPTTPIDCSSLCHLPRPPSPVVPHSPCIRITYAYFGSARPCLPSSFFHPKFSNSRPTHNTTDLLHLPLVREPHVEPCSLHLHTWLVYLCRIGHILADVYRTPPPAPPRERWGGLSAWHGEGRACNYAKGQLSSMWGRRSGIKPWAQRGLAGSRSSNRAA